MPRSLLLPAVGYKSQAPPSRRTLARHSFPLFLSLPSSFSSPSSFSLPHVKLTVTGARRLAPPFCAPPYSSEELRRSTSPPTTFPSNELSRGGQSRRHHRGFLAGNGALRRPNSSPLALLWPSRHHPRAPGEALILVDPSPLRFSHRSTDPGRPSPVTESRSGRAMPQPTWSTWPANVATGPPGRRP
jgi:hypothetical protein